MWVAASGIVCCGSPDKSVTISEPDDYISITDTITTVSKHCDLCFMSPMRAIVADNHLIIANRQTERIFTVFALPLDGSGFEAIHFGRGPEELIDPDFMSMVPDDQGFLVADADDYMKAFSISDGGISLTRKERMFTETLLNGVIKINGSFLNYNINNRERQPYEYSISRANGSKGFVSPSPRWDESIDESSFQGAFMYANCHVAQPHGDKIAEFYTRFRKVRIIDSSGHLLTETSVNYPNSAERIHDLPDGSGGYYQTYGMVVASEYRIVAQAINAMRTGTTESVSEFQVWDWYGHILQRLIIKEPINNFAVDFKSGLLYGICPDIIDAVYIADIHNYLQ